MAAPPASEPTRAAAPCVVERRFATALVHCPGRKPPFLAVKRPARPYKSAIETQFTMGNAKGAEPPREGPNRDRGPHLSGARRAAALARVRGGLDPSSGHNSCRPPRALAANARQAGGSKLLEACWRPGWCSPGRQAPVPWWPDEATAPTPGSQAAGIGVYSAARRACRSAPFDGETPIEPVSCFWVRICRAPSGSDHRFVQPLIHFITDSRTCSVPLDLRRAQRPGARRVARGKAQAACRCLCLWAWAAHPAVGLGRVFAKVRDHAGGHRLSALCLSRSR
jgi:hypothetical protein